jgi:hypothetical protein
MMRNGNPSAHLCRTGFCIYCTVSLTAKARLKKKSRYLMHFMLASMVALLTTLPSHALTQQTVVMKKERDGKKIPKKTLY